MIKQVSHVNFLTKIIPVPLIYGSFFSASPFNVYIKECYTIMSAFKVALIIEEINQSYQSAILQGITSAAAEFSLDVSAFVSFSGAIDNPKHDKGEFNIFNLPDFSTFDGAILLTNTIAYKPVIDDILTRIKAAGIPAVSIDNDIPYFYHIGIDNKTAMRNITEHLINIHGCRTFNYISGPDDNPESADRLSAFMSVLNAHCLPIENKRIYYGDFRAQSGSSAVEYFLSSGLPLPDAIICANDVMAASAINTLTKHGISVPGDVAVTGFDNTYNTHNFQIELTSVDRPLALSGRLACKMLYNHFRKYAQERNVILNMSTRFTESCGCSENAHDNIREIKELNYRNYKKNEYTQNFMSLLNKLNCDLLGSNSFEGYLTSFKKFVSAINPGEFYFCLCDNWNSGSDFENNGEDTPVPDDYTDNMLIPIAYKNGSFYNIDRVSSRELIPDVGAPSEGGKMYYYIPLHFGERCLGYMVIMNAPVPLNNAMFETFCINISNSLENIRKLTCLEYAVSRMGKLYVQDTFSGIYNRNGFVQATADKYQECIDLEREVMLMFIDLDGLKTINDTYGHSVGDEAICDIANVLIKSCQKNEIFCRFGGDEFIVFAADYSEREARELTTSIENNIAAINESKKNQYELSASTGYTIAVPKPGEDIFRFVTAADNVMYAEKRKKKLSRYLKS